MKIKKLFSFLLIFLQIFTFLNFKIKNIKAAETGGWINYNSSTKQLEIKIEGMIPPPGSGSAYYEYDVFGFVIRYHSQNGKKYLTQVKASSSDGSAGFKVTDYKQFYQGSVLYESSTNIMSLENLKGFFEKDFPGEDFSEITNPTKSSVFYFDAIYSVKGVGQTSYRGYVDDNRISRGEYYMTLNGYHLYNQNDYYKSNKYTSLSSYDTTKRGIIGSKLYDTGSSWLSVATQDITNNYNKYLVIIGVEKPTVPKSVVTNYINADTGRKISSSVTTNYNIGENSQNHTSTSKYITGYDYLYYKIDIGNGLSGQITGSKATISVNANNSKHEINFYYSKSTFDKSILIRGIDTSNNKELFRKTEVQNISSNYTFNYDYPTTNHYIYSGYRINYGNGLTALNTSPVAQINLSLLASYYEIVFYYTPSPITDTILNGNIKFNPNNSDWENSDISVQLSVNGDSEITKKGTQLREYTYLTKDWISGYYSTQIVNGETIETWISGYWGNYYYRNGISYCPFEQLWEVDKINVSVNSAKDINNANTSVSLSNTSINNGETVKIQSNANSIQLKGSVTWREKSKDWARYTYAPNGGTWGNTQLTISTIKPTETYTSYSEYFKLDKNKPIFEEVSLPNTNWINSNNPIIVNFTDNLSGLNNSLSYATITDISCLNNPQLNLTTNYSGIKNNKHSYFYQGELTKDGIYNLDVNLVDNAGNVSTIQRQGFKIDKTLPNNAIFSDDNREYIDDELNVRIGVSDNLSGIDKIELAITNSINYVNEPKQILNVTTSPNIENEMAYYDYKINNNGTYYFHIWSYDRAGNIRYTRSKEYKYYKIEPDNILVNPFGNTNKAMRGTRFDIITNIDNFYQKDFNNSNIYYTMPNWVNDKVDNKENDKYIVSEGLSTTLAKSYVDNDTLQIWQSFVTPFGVPLTYDKQGKKIGSEYNGSLQLTYQNYVFGPKKTHSIPFVFSVIPEQVIKTQILENNK